MKATMILSGGMDSATLAYALKNEGYDLCLISFDYGQRHVRELECAKTIAHNLEAEHHIVDISGIKPLLKGSSLTDDIAVPHGHYEAPNMALTVVPNRNAIMISLAWGIACANKSDVLACGVHAGDHHIYPDCRPKFIEQMNVALRTGTEEHRNENLKLTAPFVDITKTDIAAIGATLKVPYADTWTCYDPQSVPLDEQPHKELELIHLVHCGLCGACQERKEAFIDSQTTDPTEYAA